MRAKNPTLKLAALTALLLLPAATAGAASISTTDGTVWLNEDASSVDEFTVACQQLDEVNDVEVVLNHTSKEVDGSIAGIALDDQHKNATVTTSDIRQAVSDPGRYNISLSCQGEDQSNNTVNKTHYAGIDAKKLQIDVVESRHGVGFVEEVLEPSKSRGLSFLESAQIDISLVAGSPGDLSAEEVSLDTLTVPTQGVAFDDEDDYAVERSGTGLQVTLTPQITSYLEKGMVVQYSRDGNLIVEKHLDTKIFKWKVEPSGTQPAKSIEYEKIKDGSYVYGIDASWKGGDPGSAGPLLDSNFKLTVLGRQGPEDGTFNEQVSELDNGVSDGEYQKRKWLAVDLASDKKYDYKVSLENFNQLNALSPGKYKFVLWFEKDGEKYRVDSIIVDKGLSFTGRVASPGGNGVKSHIKLRKTGSTTKQLPVPSDGFYETSIQYDQYTSMSIDFQTGGSAPTSTLVIESPNLGIDASNGWNSGGSIVYNYWRNPGSVVSLDGINPVSMMAVGFGYEINGGAQLDVRYSSAGISPNEAKVYECSRWNFGSKKCNGDWEQVPARVGTRGGSFWWAHVNDLSLYTIPEDIAVGGTRKDILRNAYVVGVPAKLTLQGQLTLNKEEIAANGNLEIRGTIGSSTGSVAENADVTVKLLQDGTIVERYSATTDVAGRFTVSGQAPDEKGKYRIELEASKEPYEPLSRTSDKTISVFYSTGLSVAAPEDPRIKLGETSRIDFTLENTGQVPVNDLDVSVSGISDKYYELGRVPASLEQGASRTVTLTLDLPSDYCTRPCEPPIINLNANADSSGETLTSQASMYTSLPKDRGNGSAAAQQDSETQQQQNESGSFADGFVSPAGNLIRSQSDVNIALGLILIFALILAVAIKKRDTGNGSRRFGQTGRNPREDRINTPKISSSSGQVPTVGSDAAPDPDTGGSEEEAEEDDEDEGEQEEADDAEIVETDDGKYLYDGKEFDTKEGVELYRQT